jgi:RecB family exonuclease
MTQFFNSEAIELGPWSNSKLGTLEQCPYKFELQYVEKLKKEDIPTDLVTEVDDSALRYGNSVHKVSELVSTGEDVTAAIEKTSKENKLTVLEKKQLTAAKKNVLSFEERITSFKGTYRITKDLTELDLALGATLEKTKYFSRSTLLRGKVDRLLITGDGKTAIVIDLKTGKKATLEYAAGQLDFYTTLVLGNYPQIETVRCALFFTRLGKMLWDKPVKRVGYAMDADNSVVERINAASSAFASSEKSKINVQTLCKWCIYKEMCKVERKDRRKKGSK